MKTSTAAASTPGNDNGRYTRRNVRTGPAPRARDAAISERSMPSMLVSIGSTA
ncbi:hypothetical protein D3C72_2449800 [compost metagenome]